ncbi:sugar transferase [Lactococcus lactis]|uniref:sugar transferase n=1 Tax=Lactococcus lactis TaxID=1358 RepID=UPI00288F7B7F|nr:sugar transferase [Lactococcus lactis]MDT2887975.1 sugar transferase [Lactococcus lactis]MDT2930755.1 sugar transferase [Lactococcus lactis]
MKKFITNIHGQSEQSTAMIAQNMISKIAQREGYSEIGILAHSTTEDTNEEKEKRIEGMLSIVSERGMVVAQMPSWNGIAFDEVFLRQLDKKVDKLVIFIHDFVPLMFENNAYLFERYIDAYNLADLVILPSKQMEYKLRERGLKPPVKIQEIWDHLLYIEGLGHPEFQEKIKFAGNITRFPFVKEWENDVKLEVFSNGVIGKKEFVDMKGWKHDDQLLRELNEGGFGLVWSENIENQYEREYSKMNASFKFSTYLSAGIPIIVNKDLAKQNFVEEHNIGFVADSIYEVADYVKNISRIEYDILCSNVERIGQLVREGFFTKKLLLEIQEYLFLEEVSK